MRKSRIDEVIWIRKKPLETDRDALNACAETERGKASVRESERIE